MVTKTINLYEFDELSDKAKERAREWWREQESQDFGGFGELNEPIETVAKLLGIEFKRHNVSLCGGGKRSDPDIWWRLDCQGAGASFDGTYSYRKGGLRAIRTMCPADQNLDRIAVGLYRLQRKYRYQLSARIESDGRGHFIHQVECDAPNRDFGASTNVEDRHCRELTALMNDFARWIYRFIQDAYDDRMKDENVDYVLQNNDYTFTENGTREDI